jgi:hypothetical protein
VAWTCCGVHASRVHRPSKKHIRSSSRRRGQAYIDDDKLVVLAERPVNAVLSQSNFENRIGRHLQPHERMSFSELAAAWTKQHEVEKARILGEDQTEAA